MNLTCTSCGQAFEGSPPLGQSAVPCPACGQSVEAQSGADDFFDIGADIDTPSPPQTPPNPGKAAGAIDDGLLSDLGDFNALFDKADAKAPEPSAAPVSGESVLDDLLADFGSGSAPEAPPVPKTEPVMMPPEPPPAPKAAPPPRRAPQPPPPPPADHEVSQPDEALEELFSEVSQSSSEGTKSGEEDADLLAPELGVDYKRRRKIPKWLIWGAPSALVGIGLIVLSMAFFHPRGFFGLVKLGKSKDGYTPPSSRVLRQLDDRFAAASALFASDLPQDYVKAIKEFREILKIDARHSPTSARLAEGLLLLEGNTLSANSRKNIEELIKHAETYYPERIETIRAKARIALTEEKFGDAESRARRAQGLIKDNVDTIILLGEVLYATGKFMDASAAFEEAGRADPKYLRSKYLLAIVSRQEGNVERAERLFRELVTGNPPHVTSEIDLYHLMYSQQGKVDEAQAGLTSLLETKAAELREYDVGRAWKYVAEIAEARSDLPKAIEAMEKSVNADRTSHANGFYLGRLYLLRREFEKAEQQFARASSLSPQTPEYLIYRGHALRELGKSNDSLIDLKKALEKNPSHIEGLFQLGLTQRSLARADEAIASFESVLKNDPRHVDALINLGELYLARDNFSMALTNLKAALALVPQSARALNALGELLLTTRKPNEALEALTAAEKVEPQNVPVLANIGKVHLNMGKIDLASTYFDKALALDPSRVDTQVALGDLQFTRKEYTKAIETFRRVLEVNPKDYATRVKVGKVMIEMQSYQDAIRELQEALKWNPDFYETHLRLGIAWRELGNLESSIEEFGKALVVRPEAADGHYQLELTYIYRNDPINAKKSMESAGMYDPTFVDPYIAMGDYYFSKNAYSNATEYYQKAEKISPKDSDILLKIAESLRRDSKFKTAVKYYNSAIKNRPKNADAYLGLGIIAEEQGKAKNAVNFFKRAQKSDPNDPRSYYYLGFVYKDMNRKNDAVLAFRKYLQLDPQSAEKQDIEDTIFQLTRN